MNKPKIKLAYLVSHPIQYQVKLLQTLSSSKEVDLTVFYCNDSSLRTYHDPGFGGKIKWDIDLLSGYKSNFLNQSNPFSFVKMLKKEKIDVLWVHGYSTPFILTSIILAKMIGIKVLVRSETVREFSQRGIKTYLRPLFFKLLNCITDGFLTIGTRNRDFFSSYGIPETKLFFAPYTVDNSAFQINTLDNAAAPLSLDADRSVILFVGKFQPRKRPDDLLKAYIQLIQKEPYKTKPPYLLLLGDGELRNVLSDTIHTHQLQDHVKLLGFKNQTELPSYYQLADVFVLPSLRENWGLVLNEAMNGANAVIVSDQIGSAPDLVQAGTNGVVFPAGDIDKLTTALNDVLACPDQQKKMKQASIDIINQWGITQTAEGIIDACQQVMLNKKQALTSC